MNTQTTTTRAAKTGNQEDIVTLWQQAVLGNRAAKRVLLARIMPESEIETATVIAFEPATKDQRQAA